MRRHTETFFCFSPAVMLGTFLIEYTLALWTLFQHGATRLGRLVGTGLILLGTFQLTEYLVCGMGFSARPWLVPGLIAITFLPPVGLHITKELTRRPIPLHWAYGFAVGYSWLFIAQPKSMVDSFCTPNYLVLHFDQFAGFGFALFYTVVIAVSLWEAMRFIVLKPQAKEREAVAWLVVGYAAFLLPTAIVYYLTGIHHIAVPSVMCGFALLLAVVLAARVLPLAAKTTKE